MVSLNAQEKIKKNILLFQYQLKKKLDNNKTITYKLEFVESFRFMSNKLSDLVDKLSEIYKKECKGCEERKKLNQYVILLDSKVIN